MKRFSYLVKYYTRKVLSVYLYKRYVEKNTIIHHDININFDVRKVNIFENSIKLKFIHLMVYYPEFAMIFFWRVSMRSKYIDSLFGLHDYLSCRIFKSCKIGGGIVCYHPFSTIINASKIGYNFTFRNNITIGNKHEDNSKIPIIGNNVSLGSNVVIIGDIIIGDNVIIGAGSVVTKSVESNSIVAGNPAKLIRKF